MSQVLGRQDCMESLRRDLIDLQGALLDVFSRTRPVRCYSWKFPDKLSCSLDMVALLEQYDFVEGEEQLNQHSYTVLLELVIDRLLLLLQSFDAYVEQLRSSHKTDQTQEKGCLSIGLIVIKYWTNLVQFANTEIFFKDTKKHTKPKMLDCKETKTLSSPCPQNSSKNDCKHCLSTCSSTNSTKLSPQSNATSSPIQSTSCYPTVDSHNVSCQTVESSLLPCSACHQVQALLRKTGDALIELFQGEGLPSSLQPLLITLEDTLEKGLMSSGDVVQWTSEQLRDMRRLAKHLQDVRATVQPLSEKLAAAEAEQEKFRSQLENAQKDLNQEMEKHNAIVLQLELSLQRAQKSIKETEQRLQEEQQHFQTETSCLEKSNSRLHEQLAVKQDALKGLERERNALEEKVRTLNVVEEACCKLQERIQQLECQISESQLLLGKENAKYHSACRQQESMQAKQNSLLKRVDALDQECEELQKQLGEREDREIDLRNQLQQMSEEKELLQAEHTPQQDQWLELQKEKQTLETRVSKLTISVAELMEYVQSLRENERLLVAFPELSPLAQAQPQSTGNVLLDMEQQLQANCIRIRVLEQENVTLLSSLVKLKERAQNYDAEKNSHLQTGSVSLPSTPEETQQNYLTQMQTTPSQSNSAVRLGDRGKEAKGGKRGNHVAPATAAANPSSLQIHLQTVQFDISSTAAKTSTNASRMSYFSQTGRFEQRKK